MEKPIKGYLFIGGDADGRFIDAAGKGLYIRPFVNAGGEVVQQRYIRNRIHTDGGPISVYLLEGVSTFSAFMSLITKYAKK